MGQAVYHRLLLQWPDFKSGLVHVNLWQSHTGTSFSPSISASPHQYHSTNAPHSSAYSI